MMDLTALPIELHLQILEHLDLISLLKATSTNKYFHSLLNKNPLRGALMRHESVLLQYYKDKCPLTWSTAKSRFMKNEELLLVPNYNHSSATTDTTIRRYRCYSCCRSVVLPVFEQCVTGSPWDLCGDRAGERRCMKCEPVTNGDFVERILDEAGPKHGTWFRSQIFHACLAISREIMGGGAYRNSH